MAGEDRATNNNLEMLRDLREQPRQYSFYAALRLYECAYRDRPRLGESAHPSEDAIRLGQDPHLTFATSTLSEFTISDGRPPRLGSYFLGLFGPHGPLPLHLTKFIYERVHNARDVTFARFVDIFHHRILSLFYRAWSASQPAISYDRPGKDKFGNLVSSLVGLGFHSLRDRDAMPDNAKMHFAGFLLCQGRNPDGLQSILSAFFEMPARIQEFVGDWMEIPKSIQTRLGGADAASALGGGATIGGRSWGAHQKFRIIFGPMKMADYRRMLPGGESLARLMAIVRNYAGDELDWDVNLLLKADEVPLLRLGQQEPLGRTTWLHRSKEEGNATEMFFRPMHYVAVTQNRRDLQAA